MSVQVTILESVKDKLTLPSFSKSLLVGVSCDAWITILDVVAVPEDIEGLYDIGSYLLPHGLHFLGVCGSSDEAVSKHMEELLESSLAASIPEIFIKAVSSSCLSFRIQQRTTGKWDDTKPAFESQPNVSRWIQSKQLCIRCHTRLPLYVLLPGEGQPSSQVFQDALASAFKQLEAQLTAPNVMFLLQDYRSGTQHLLTPTTPGTAHDLHTPQAPHILDTSPLITASPATPAPSHAPPAPVFHYTACPSPSLTTSTMLHLDVLCYVPLTTPQSLLAAHHLQPALLSQLTAIHRYLASLNTLMSITAHHFLLADRAHHVTLLYPTDPAHQGVGEDKLLPYRTRVHRHLGLPMDRPAVRISNALTFDHVVNGGEPVGKAASRLQNVHESLPYPHIGGRVSLVHGTYDYYHYMQDKMNDSGWGCAYRSCQTLCSWFLHQAYTARPPPSHADIQQLLVSVGDKPRAFVGSTNWIGAIELSYVLDEHLGVASKVICVSRGSDIPSHARELAAHFDTQGTPVMIGGGVLAYTLLGVAFNEETGDCAFLILDPHYPGGEDLKKIQGGGWVAWKSMGENAAAGGPLFVPNAFYNFLCPQRPKTI